MSSVKCYKLTAVSGAGVGDFEVKTDIRKGRNRIIVICWNHVYRALDEAACEIIAQIFCQGSCWLHVASRISPELITW